MSNLPVLWQRHYKPEITGSYHGDMARAFDLISKDTECTLIEAMEMRRASAEHVAEERKPTHVGRKWFCELFGLPHERIATEAYDYTDPQDL